MSLRSLRTALHDWTPGRGLALAPLHALAAAWPAIVGDDVAAHSAPLAVNGATLLVATRSSAWSQQLQFLSPRILGGIRELLPALAVDRIAFRTGALPSRERLGQGSAKSSPVSRPRGERPPEPAPDLPSAIARLRRRLARVREAAPATCTACGAPLERARAALCAPCAGMLDAERAIALERLLYMAPWLGCDELQGQFPGLGSAEYERSRRRLLQRWWLLLERVRRAARPRAARLERQIASSYVLLHSRLPPDRVTPAVVRNLLGTELEALLWPEHSPQGGERR